MIKMLAVFVLFWTAFAIGIDLFRKLSGKEKWELAKLIGYASLCALITIFFLSGIVILF